ncbi:inositol monophosphatase [Patescibacteria group bacterium]|nr:inositol monophosphatase [Patescibacteria group bacterium]
MSFKKQFKTAREAAILASKIQLESFGRKHDLTPKEGRDFATEVDFASEEVIINAIKRNFPADNILSEEKGTIDGQSRYMWVVDPLDGTVNYSLGFAYFCVIIALYDLKKDETLMSIVYNPITKDLYYAEKGCGAYLNNQEISVSSRTKLEDSCLALGALKISKKDVPGKFSNQHHLITSEEFLRKRVVGSAGLDTANVAKGAFDAYVSMGGGAWDYLGPGLLVDEAGGQVVDENGQALTLQSHGIVACGSGIFDQVINLLEQND